jgi:glutathione S-transferase
MSITFYYKPMSSATRVHWALEELGVPYEKVLLKLDGDQKAPDFVKLNPNGKVPLLVVDGHPIFESLAQLLWLGETYGVDKGLFPAPGIERAEAFKWMVWGSVTVHEAIAFVLKNGDRVPEEERNAKARERAVKELTACFAMLDAHLEGKDYILGKNFSLADCSLAAFIPFAARMGADISAMKNLQAWSARSTQRPALGRAMQG